VLIALNISHSHSADSQSLGSTCSGSIISWFSLARDMCSQHLWRSTPSVPGKDPENITKNGRLQRTAPLRMIMQLPLSLSEVSAQGRGSQQSEPQVLMQVHHEDCD